MIKSSLKFVLSCLAVCAALPLHAQTPSVEQLIQKCLAVYDKAKTYRGTMTLMEQTPQVTNTVMIQIQAESAPNGMIKRDTMTIAANKKRMKLLDDGTSLYTLDVEKRVYRIVPHRPDKISGLFRASLDKILQVKSHLKVSETQTGGSKVYMITGAPNQSKTLLLINAANYQFESLRVTRTQSRRTQTMSITLTGQKFNVPLPASVFTWKVPAGYKKM